MRSWTLVLVVSALLGLWTVACGDDETESTTDMVQDSAEDAAGDAVVDTGAPDSADDTAAEDLLEETSTDVSTDEGGDDVADDMGTDTAEPDACLPVCEGLLAAACEFGPGTVDECLGGCNETLADETCGGSLQSLLDCLGSDLTFTCDQGVPAATACATEQDELDACLTPSDTCEDVCVDLVAAGCGNGPSNITECVDGCQSLQGGLCELELDGLLSCAADNPGFECDANDSAVVAGGFCDDEQTALNACVGSFETTCAEMCAPLAAANCAAGATEDDCNQGCRGELMGGCAFELMDMFDCYGATPTFTCDTSDVPVVVGCETEEAAFVSCIEG